MGLFDQIINALDNPAQQANPGQLGGILDTVDQMSGRFGADPTTMQSALSVVGSGVRSALQQKQATEGNEYAQGLVNQFGGTNPNSQIVDILFSGAMQNQLIQQIVQRTGMDPSMIQNMLPFLVPIVLKFLQGGANTQNPQSGNPLLNNFLDADNDGDVDMGDAMGLASRFLNR
ncbi:DUF937 domain-containing protein [Microcoleus sp. FACHB-831]|uniref:DUF937 domain-containing protein n=1 Tax=Microcoleus sp. FACHB-831 TaxID=2692827 RepID=UPI001683CFE9|nr:DUF937 domain-containing protein [Microcoleus sp. FACHB-831]MBD1921790.1 DUF937 domain-containing protein [Microcoleus sp. FACHB-831]